MQKAQQLPTGPARVDRMTSQVGNARPLQFSLRGLLIATAILAVVLALAPHRVKTESIRRYADTMVTFRSLIQELEAIHAKTGSYPKDEEDCVAIRGEALPETEYGGSFFYTVSGDHQSRNYELSFCGPGLFGDFITYDSSTPERGVFSVPW